MFGILSCCVGGGGFDSAGAIMAELGARGAKIRKFVRTLC